MRVLIAVLFLASLASVGYCWAPDGHRIVAMIAQHLITPVTQRAVYTWTNGRNLSDIANDPDNFLYLDRAANGWSAPMHYINTPVDAKSFSPDLHCVGPCVYTAVLNYTALLRKTPPSSFVWSNTSGGEPNLLSFLVHFVGDMHQPMHVGFDVDHGGNSLWLLFYGKAMSLHYLWDHGLVSEKFWRQSKATGKDYTWVDLAYELLRKNLTVLKMYGADQNVIDWVTECFLIARQSCYNFLPEKPYVRPPTPPGSQSPPFKSSPPPPPSSKSMMYLSDNYYTFNYPLIEEQLMKAGSRLAALLNSIYDPHSAKFPMNLQRN